MKVKYDLSENYFKAYNEVNGVALARKILKGKNIRTIGYIQYFFKRYCLMFIFSVMIMGVLDLFGVLIFKNPFYIIRFLFLVLFVSFLLALYQLIIAYRKNVKNNQIGQLTFSKNGILDKAIDGMSFELPWDKIEFLAICTNVCVFVIKDSFILINVNSECSGEILKAVDKYNKNLKIYDFSK